jgi:hypothetical protein
MSQEQDHQSAIWPQGMQDDYMNTRVSEDYFHFAGLENGQSDIDTPMGRLTFGNHNAQQVNAKAMGYNNGEPINACAGGLRRLRELCAQHRAVRALPAVPAYANAPWLSCAFNVCQL